MLEEIALQYVNQSESGIRAINYGLVILGAIIAGITIRSSVELRRAPYFAYSALIFLFVSASEIVWLQLLPAMIGGYLWVLMAISIAASVIGGFFFGRIGIARSRDAYGHGRNAVLAFIPIANLLLLLKPSRDAVSVNRAPTIPLLTGGSGVLSGFVMLAAAIAITAYLKTEAERVAKQFQADPEASIAFMIRSQSLEQTLRLMAAEVRTPITVDDVTTLTRIEADGTQLRRTYVVTLAIRTIPDDFRTRHTNGICAHGPFIPLLRAGATIREVYVNADGSPIGAVLVTSDVCGL